MKIQREITIKELRQRVNKMIEKENGVYRDDYYISKRKLLSILKELLEPEEDEVDPKEHIEKMKKSLNSKK